MFINSLDPEKVKNMSLVDIIEDVIKPDIEKKQAESSEDRIESRKPKKYKELIAILKKEHEETFKGITLDAQLDKFIDEQEEYEEADNCLEQAREMADMMIVAAGIARFCPRFVEFFVVPTLVEKIEENPELSKGIITQLALEKSIVNKNRDWSKKGGKYQHK